MCVGREREKTAIGQFITGVASAGHGLALIGRSTEVRGRRVQSMTCYHACGPGVSSGGVSCCPVAAHNCEEARYGMGR